MWDPAGDIAADCEICKRNIGSTLDNYLKHPKRSCISQYFLNEVSRRIKPCTNRKVRAD